MHSPLKDVFGKIAEKLPDFTDDLLSKAALTLHNDDELIIENHLGIVSYDTREIRINTKDYMLIIKGEGLYIKNLVEFEVGVKGRIISLELVRSE